MGQIIVSLVAIGVSVYFGVTANGYQAAAAQMPILLSYVTGGLAVLMLLQGLRHKFARPGASGAAGGGAAGGGAAGGETGGGEQPIGWPAARRVTIFSALMIAYAIALQPLGFLIAMPAFLLASLFIFRAIKPLTAALVTLAVGGLVYGVFIVFLRLPVPLLPSF